MSRYTGIPVYIKCRLMNKKLGLSKDYESTFFGQIGYATPPSERENGFNVLLPRQTRSTENVSNMQNNDVRLMRLRNLQTPNLMKGLQENDFKRVLKVSDFLKDFGNSPKKTYMIYSKDDNISDVSSLSTAYVNQQNNNVYVGEIQKVGENIKITNIMTNENFNSSDIDILVIFDDSGVVTMKDKVIIEFSPIEKCMDRNNLNRNHQFLFNDSNVAMYLPNQQHWNSKDNKIKIVWFSDIKQICLEKKVGVDKIRTAHKLPYVQKFFSWRFDHGKNKPPTIDDKTIFQILKTPDNYIERKNSSLSGAFKNKRYYKIYTNNCKKVFLNAKKYLEENKTSFENFSILFSYEKMYDILTKKAKEKDVQHTDDEYIICIMNKD